MIELLERDFSSFFTAPFHAYGADTPYVSPMMADLKRFLSIENPLFSNASDFTFFSVKRYGKPVGRITAHLHRGSNDLHHEARGCFGYFDCANDPEVATVLLQAAENWSRAKGMTRLVGNFNLTAMQQAGIMTGGFDQQPFTDQIWGPPHLPGLLEANGFQPHFPMTTFERRLDTNPIPEVLPNAQRSQLLDQGFSFVRVTHATIAERLEDARAILNRSFKNNPMFVPVTAEEFHFQAKDMKWIMDPRISKVVHYRGAPAGAVIAIPDLNPLLRRIGSRLCLSLPFQYLRYKARRDRAVVIFQGVMPEFQGRSVNPLMLSEMTRDMIAAGYKTVGGTWIADENAASLRQTEKAGAAPLHRLHLFSKELV
ncbi:GNAT family N-acetyltransferase [Ruegeria arenilitoris]|uniref:GNAT family N-acetyltransferase n=1 Tax=Ruegeria arenilitoris TaxID=1173585 RepID=UPI001480430C|nr:GNAT family N-acetyltransferase [Ruegeria arenilitoris]